jgi:hypothetical protein
MARLINRIGNRAVRGLLFLAANVAAPFVSSVLARPERFELPTLRFEA